MKTRKIRPSPFDRYRKLKNQPELFYDPKQWKSDTLICYFAEKYQLKNGYPYFPDFRCENGRMKALRTYINRHLTPGEGFRSLIHLIHWIFMSGQKEVIVTAVADLTFDLVSKYYATANHWAEMLYDKRMKEAKAKRKNVSLEEVANIFGGVAIRT